MLQREKQDVLARMLKALRAQQEEIKKFVEEYEMYHVDVEEALAYKEASVEAWESSTDWYSSSASC